MIRRGAYALPSVFTAGTVFCGYYAIMNTLQAIGLPAERTAEAAANLDFERAAALRDTLKTLRSRELGLSGLSAVR
jgi:phosphatidylserine synthase